MDSLGHVYEDAILHKYGLPAGWVANWPVGKPQHLGDVGTVEDLGFNKTGALSDYGVTASPDDTPDPPSGPWELKSSNSITVEFGIDASAPGWEWIGKANAGLKLGFGAENGLVLYVGSSRYGILKNIEGLKAQLIEAGKAGKIPLGRSVIVEQLIADNALVMGSRGQTGKLQATTNFDIKPGDSPTLASFAADFKIDTDFSASTHEGFPNGGFIAMRVITLVRRGWLWWRHFTALGLEAITLEDALTVLEYTASKDDYFAPFPDAFSHDDTRTL